MYNFKCYQDTLEFVIREMAERKVHRVWVVDNNGRPLKCISHRDVLYNVLHKPIVTEA